MNLTGKYVNHNTFGKGIVVLIDDNKIEVEFDLGRKKFIYPDVFKSFMCVEDKTQQEYVDGVLFEIDRKHNIKLEKDEKETQRLERIKSLRVGINSQAIFGFLNNDFDEVLNTWSVSTGTYLSGYSKGEPRVPQRLNINSACLLTMKPEGMHEKERIILGAFMVPDDFKGSDCQNGIIHAHEKYRIILKPEQEQMKLGDYFSSNAKSEKWGQCEMKYFSNVEMQSILSDMTKIIKDADRCEKALEFYNYFCNINKLE